MGVVCGEDCFREVKIEYEKLVETKNDLELYKPLEEIYYRAYINAFNYYREIMDYPSTCPICSEKLNESIIKELRNTIKDCSSQTYIDLKKNTMVLLKIEL